MRAREGRSFAGIRVPMIAALAFGAAPASAQISRVQATPEARQAVVSKGSNLQAGEYEFALTHDGRKRNYLLHVPPHSPEVSLPVVLNFHGGGGSADGQRDHSQMNPFADREGFIVVYPNGTGFFSDRLLTWNAGTCCGYAMKHNIDDVGFALAILDDLAAKISIDRTRVYATGHSNGAMMAYRMATDAGRQIAAIAPVAGGMVVMDFHPARPMPIMHFHSTDDPRALYYGGLGPPFPFTNNRVMHPNVETMLARWRAFDKCPSNAEVAPTISGAPKGPDEGVSATKFIWRSCSKGTEVVLWKFTGSGHVWPGGRQGVRPRLLGRGTTLIDANEQMWRFFSRFSLPPSTR